MLTNAARQKWFEMPPSKRLSLARSRVKDISNRAVVLVRSREANEVIQSEILSRQIGPSFAARAFNSFRETTLHSFISRLMTFWDPSSIDRKSLPSVADLVDDREVTALIWQAAYDTGLAGIDVIEERDPMMREWLQTIQRKDALKNANERADRLQKALADVRLMQKDPLQVKLRDFRDVHLSHALTDNVRKLPLDRSVHGDEEKLFAATIKLIDEIETVVSHGSFNWASIADNAKRDAVALWHGCSFKPLE